MTTTCDGKVGWHPLSAYTAIMKDHEYGTAVKNECIFVMRSKIGRKILKVCPKDFECCVEETLKLVTNMKLPVSEAINRIGTPSQMLSLLEKKLLEKSVGGPGFSIHGKAKNCVVDTSKVKCSASSISEILFDGTCSQQGNALYSEFFRQSSYLGITSS